MRVGAANALVVFALACGARTPLEDPAPSARRLDAAVDGARRVPDAPSAVPDAPDGGPRCVPGRSVPRRATADLVFVIDRSGSMSQTIDGLERAPRELWRWTLLEAALGRAVAVLDERARVGATFFPNPSARPRPDVERPCLTTIGLDVEVSTGGVAEMLEIFERTDPFGGTPTADAIAETRRWLARSAEARRFIVLATDGGPNCNPDLTTPGCVCTGSPMICDATGGGASCLDDLRTIGVVSETFRDGHIPVYVVGIEDLARPELAEVLDEMAVAGGRPRGGTGRRYYSVRSSADLEQALTSVTSEIALCGYELTAIPEREAALHVLVDEVAIAEGDPNGWSWADRDRGELELVGTACERVRSGASITALVDACD